MKFSLLFILSVEFRLLAFLTCLGRRSTVGGGELNTASGRCATEVTVVCRVKQKGHASVCRSLKCGHVPCTACMSKHFATCCRVLDEP